VKFLFRLFNVILVIVLLLVVAGSILNYLQIFSSKKKGQNVTFSIAQGSSTGDIATVLEDKGLVKSSFIFKLVVKHTKTGDKLQAGDYTLNTGMSMMEIIENLKKGQVARTYDFTVPEGFTARQIAGLLKEKGAVNEQEFLDIVKTGGGIKFKYSHLLKGHSLEGFLFPDTYSVYKDSTPREIIEKMVKRFEEVVPSNTEQIAKKRGLSFYKMIVLASLVEREARVEDERPLVAAVYYNRIKLDMLLECDATIQFLFDKPKEILLYKDLEIDSPYNTYKYKGLPPGPIANPGLPSIKAALYPASVDYLYYVVKGEGRHKFSKTFEEHQKAVEEYRNSEE